MQINDPLYTQTLYPRREGCRYPVNSRLDGVGSFGEAKYIGSSDRQ